MANHVPGNPSIIVQSLPAAGGMVMRYQRLPCFLLLPWSQLSARHRKVCSG
jgi:hypothetical protein